MQERDIFFKYEPLIRFLTEYRTQVLAVLFCLLIIVIISNARKK